MRVRWKDLGFWGGRHHSKLLTKLEERRALQKTILPENPKVWFKPFELCPVEQTKVVFLGLHPSPRQNVNDGLAHSTRVGTRPLGFTGDALLDAVKQDIGGRRGHDASLTNWARQGVLLLNRFVTCELDDPMAHDGFGWEYLCTEVIGTLNHTKAKKNYVFVLPGPELGVYHKLINTDRHTVIRINKLSANNIWDTAKVNVPIRSSGIFNYINEVLGPKQAIDWKLQ